MLTTDSLAEAGRELAAEEQDSVYSEKEVEDFGSGMKPNEDPPLPGKGVEPSGVGHEKTEDSPFPEKGAENLDSGGKGNEERLLFEGEAPAEAEPFFLEESSPKLRLLPNQVGDAELYEAWEQWHDAYMRKDIEAEKRALEDLLRLRLETGARAFEAFAVGLMRAAASRDFQNDKAGAQMLTQAAMQLAADLPATYIGATSICLQHFSEEWRHCAHLSWQVVKSWAADPRYRRSTLADVGVALLFSFVLTSVVVLLVLLFRSLPCLFADFYAFFQKLGFPKWFGWTVLLGTLSLPLLLGIGLTVIFLFIFLVIALYLRRAERLFITVLIFAMSLLPFAGEWFAHRTLFGGTLAEKLWTLDLGGPGAEGLAYSWKEDLRTSRGSFVKLAALGTFELRRGDNEAAIEHLRRALSLRAEEPRAMNNLGVALFLKGEIGQAYALFERAARVDLSLGEPFYNLALLLQWPSLQGAVLEPQEHERISELFAMAFEKTPRLLELRPLTAAGAISANTFLQTVSLDSRDILNAAKLETGMELELIRLHLARSLVFDSPSLMTPWMVLWIGVMILLLSFLGDSLDMSKRCALCGEMRRKKMLSMDRSACLDCTRVFLQKNAGVEPLFGLNKRLDTARFRKQHKRLVYGLSLLWPGAGLLYMGKFISGAFYGFAFGSAMFALIYWQRFIRVPYSEIAFSIYAIPLVVVFGLVYFLSLTRLLRLKDT
ncbi:MAG: tetratricopeptide repeat protein [Cystobacterineae bacterium]|nr:tetratricopeptide repeat protein [Cystobacterineae bacterium]